MDPLYLGFIGVFALVLLIIIRVPIAFALAGVGVLGLTFMMGISHVISFVPHQIYSRTADFTFTAVPLFLLMGYFAYYAGITDEAYDVARAWVGRVPGGLGLATVAGCALFAASAGSSLGECAAMSKIAVPEMRKSGYSAKLATGLVASAGGLAVVIPPSVIMVIYGVLTEQSVGKLLVAGILPGALYFAVFAVAIMLFAMIWPNMAPLESTRISSWSQRFRSLGKIWEISALFAIAIGGIYAGLVTPTEGAALGAFAAILLTAIKRRLSWSIFKLAVLETVSASAVIFMLFVSADVFTMFLNLSGVLQNTTNWLLDLNLSRDLLFWALVLLFVIMGSFLDAISIMLVTLPLVMPIIEAQNLSPVWFGVIMCMIVEIGCITPPMGLNVYVMKAAMGKSIELNDIFMGALPFVVLELIIVGILFYFPEIALWLPSLMVK
ncbi:MAG: TRAP transporter large permease [Deltaproteobacteria bacterium]|nr:TRAP transporter large permease [Deltaproteobacteria bacterium]